MKGYLVIFIVLLVVLGCNDSEPKQVPFTTRTLYVDTMYKELHFKIQ